MTRSSTIRVLGVAIVATAMAVVVHTGSAVSTDGLLALWLLDEGAGDTTADASGNGNDGTFTDSEGLPEWADGKAGGGVAFSQAGWIDTAAPIIVGGSGFTMGAWVNCGDEQKAFTNIMSSHAEPPRRGISFEQNNDNLNLYGVAMGGGENWMGCGDYGFQMETGVWQHMVVTRADDGETADSYIDGEPVLVDGRCAEPTAIGDAQEPFRLGSWVLGEAGRAWNGVLDEAFVMNRALNANEVKSLYRNGWEAALDVSPRSGLVTAWAALKARAE